MIKFSKFTGKHVNQLFSFLAQPLIPELHPSGFTLVYPDNFRFHSDEKKFNCKISIDTIEELQKTANSWSSTESQEYTLLVLR